MGKMKTKTEDVSEVFADVVAPVVSTTFEVYQPSELPVGFPGLIKLENRTSVEIDVTLTDGTNIRMWPKQKKKQAHFSKPFLRKLLPEYINKLVSKGDVRIVDAV